jgi:hypothetical protein
MPRPPFPFTVIPQSVPVVIIQAFIRIYRPVRHHRSRRERPETARRRARRRSRRRRRRNNRRPYYNCRGKRLQIGALGGNMGHASREQSSQNKCQDSFSHTSPSFFLFFPKNGADIFSRRSLQTFLMSDDQKAVHNHRSTLSSYYQFSDAIYNILPGTGTDSDVIDQAPRPRDGACLAARKIILRNSLLSSPPRKGVFNRQPRKLCIYFFVSFFRKYVILFRKCQK